VAVITIGDRLWEGLVEAGRRKRKKPESLAAEAVEDFLQRLADEELLRRSAREARRSPLSMAEAEKAIRNYRRRKVRS
jgi:hypothetical protein